MSARDRREAECKLGLPHTAKESADSGDVPKTPPSWEADPNEQLSAITRGPVSRPSLSQVPWGNSCTCAHTHTLPIHELNQERQGAPATHQRKVVGVDPDNA